LPRFIGPAGWSLDTSMTSSEIRQLATIERYFSLSNQAVLSLR